MNLLSDLIQIQCCNIRNSDHNPQLDFYLILFTYILLNIVCFILHKQLNNL